MKRMLLVACVVVCGCGSQVGRYQLQEHGGELWRFDTTTGKACMLTGDIAHPPGPPCADRF